MKNKTAHLNNTSTHLDHIHSNNIFDNIEMFVGKFDGVERDEWQKPTEVIKSFALQKDAIVVEVGAGTGYFAVRLAPYVEKGKVICFDQSSQMTSYLQNRVKELKLNNVFVHTARSNGNLDLAEKADLIFSVDVYHHLQDQISFFTKIAKNLKPDGTVIVIDRTHEEIKGQPSGHRVSEEQVKTEMKDAGFEFVKKFDFLLPIQYFLVFKKIT